MIDGGGNDRRLFDRAVSAVERFEKEGIVLVSCWAGKSRSVVIAAAAISKAEGISADDALDKISGQRNTSVSTGLLPLLYAYDHEHASGGVNLSVERLEDI